MIFSNKEDTSMAMPGMEQGSDFGTRAVYWTVAVVVYAVVFTVRAPARVIGTLWSDDTMEPRLSLMTEARSAARAAAGYAVSV